MVFWDGINSGFSIAGISVIDPFGTLPFWQNTATHMKVNQWLDEDKRAHTVDDGTTACGRYYQYLKNQMEQGLEGMMGPMRTVMKNTLMHNPNMQEAMRSPAMAQQFRLIDSIIRKRHPDDHGKLYSDEYNHKFLTEDSTGKIVAMGDDAIVKLFRQRGEGEVFPHIVLTSSHAQGETLDDVTVITHGIESLARDSEGQALPHAHVDTGIPPGKTLTLYACDVEKSPMLNGANLLDRINELKRISRTGKVESEYNGISPGAKRIAKLMLKCMVEDPAMVDTTDERLMSQIAADNAAPIRLRADAVEIAHHFQLIGYSKGGNVVSDAMRYLVGELTAKNAQGADVFQVHPDCPNLNENDTTMTKRNVSKIVRNIAVMALASIEVGMTDRYKEYGVRRVAINSDKDLISAHRNYDDSLRDERWIIHGVDQHSGHAPQDMMGTRAGQKGYAHDDPRVARRLKEFFAPNFGKAAIGRVAFKEGAGTGEVIIEAATGTTDEQIHKFVPVIKKAIAKGLKLRPSKVECTEDPEWPGVFTLKCDGANFAASSEALQGLMAGFQELRSTNTKGLVITQSILDEDGDIAQQLKKTTNRGRG